MREFNICFGISSDNPFCATPKIVKAPGKENVNRKFVNIVTNA
jgi:hypothetical protein